jgi:hypothetical protein
MVIAVVVPAVATAVVARVRMPPVVAPAEAMETEEAMAEIAAVMVIVVVVQAATVIVAAVVAISSAGQWDPEAVAPVAALVSAETAASTPAPRSAAGSLPAGIQVSI